MTQKMPMDSRFDPKNELIEKGFTSCFEKNPAQHAEGRIFLQKAAELGRKDAYFYIGASFELENKFKEAGVNYAIGSEIGHTPAKYRLAMLHFWQRIPDSDRITYLMYIREGSEAGHIPSRIKYAGERVKGGYGLREQVVGVFCFIPRIISAIIAASRDMEGPNMLR